MSLNRSKTLLAAVLSLATIGTTLTTATQQASAGPIHIGHHGGHWGHHGWGRGFGYAGIGLGLGLLGAAAYESAYAAPCRIVRQFDEYGNYVGRVRVCE